MIYHAEMVGRAVERALVVVDMPFPTCHLGACKAIEVAGRILKETRCRAVKLEGGAEQADTIAAMVSAGIPVMAHCGLRPQSVHVLGGYKVQRDEERLLADAQAAQQAGAFAVLLECIPYRRWPADHRDSNDPHDRHRCRPRLRRPGAGRKRHAGHHQRVRAAVCQDVRPSARRHSRRRRPLSARGPRRHLPGRYAYVQIGRATRPSVTFST